MDHSAAGGRDGREAGGRWDVGWIYLPILNLPAEVGGEGRGEEGLLEGLIGYVHMSVVYNRT